MASTGRKVHLLLLIVINVLLTNPIHGAADSDANPTGKQSTRKRTLGVQAPPVILSAEQRRAIEWVIGLNFMATPLERGSQD